MKRLISFIYIYRYSIALILTFSASRSIISLMGVEFDATPLSSFWQYIDIDLLKNNLAESLFYLHSQPPLYNLFLGVGVKLFPDTYTNFFQIIYMFMSFTIYIMMFHILKTYGINSLLSFIVATIFIISPEAILYENWLFYTWPMAFLFVASVYSLQKYKNTLAIKYAMIFLFMITLMAFTRTSFHLVLIILSIIVLILISEKNRKKILFYSLIPIILVSGLYTKNLVLFNTFGSSSWMGMNISRIATSGINHSSLIELEDKKYISNLTRIGGFQPLDKYPKAYSNVPNRFSEIKILRDKYKSNGSINLNHYGYIKISKTMKNDSFYIIKNNLPTYFKSVIGAWRIYSMPSWRYYTFLSHNYESIKKYINFITLQNPRMFLEEYILGKKNNFTFPYSSLILIPISMLIVLIYFVNNILQYKKNKNIDYIYFYMIFMIFFLAIIGNSLEIGENNRFRVMTDPLLYMLVILSLYKYIKKFYANRTL